MGRGILVVTIKFGEDPYGFMGRFQALNGSGKRPVDLANEIFGILLNHKQTSRRMSEALVSMLENSDSFAAAKANIALVEQAKYCDASLADRLRAVIAENVQVASSFGVPLRVTKLTEKWESSLTADRDRITKPSLAP